MSVEEIRKEVWLGHIPLRVQLCEQEVTTTPEPATYNVSGGALW